MNRQRRSMNSEKDAVSVSVSDESSETQIMELASPPEVLRFESLCHLYEQYVDLLVSREHHCPRGIRVKFERYHFFHLVKLSKGLQTAFKMAVEEGAILACKEGFGGYSLDAKRAAEIAWLPELISNPHEIYEYGAKKTADEVFIREYNKSGSPFKVFLVKQENDYLVPVTSMTVKRQGIKEHRRGKKVHPK